MGPSSVREDLDQLIEEWRSHRGAEISLLKGLAAANERLDKLDRALEAQGAFITKLEERIAEVLGAKW
jgi:hypothetical protein